MDAGADDAGDAGDEHDAGPSVDAGTSAGSAREPDTVKLWATFPKGATPIVLACEGPRACKVDLDTSVTITVEASYED
jgi:hypothetical protein